MVKKITKYAKFVVCCALIMSLVAPSYAALSASDGSAFVTKAEFDSALADFNARLTTFEAGINSKIDSQVTSYLDRNGIWNGQKQSFSGNVNYNLWDILSLYDKHTYNEDPELTYKRYVITYVHSVDGTSTYLKASGHTYYEMPAKKTTSWVAIDNINKSGLLILDYAWRYVAQLTSDNPQTDSWYKLWLAEDPVDPATLSDGTDGTSDRGWGIGFISRDAVANVLDLAAPTGSQWGNHNWAFYSLQHNLSFYTVSEDTESIKANQILFSSAPSQTGIQTVQSQTNSIAYGYPPISCNYNTLRGQSQFFVAKGDKIKIYYNHVLGGRQAYDYYVTVASLIKCLLWMYDAQVY